MPLFTYTCRNKKCDAYDGEIDAMVKLSAVDKEIPCPVCKKPLAKLVSAPHFRVR